VAAAAAVTVNLKIMCGCKDCKEITLLGGLDGVGIASIVSNSFGTMTFNYTNGQSVTLACPCAQSQVKYQVERLGVNTSGTSPAFTTLTNMTYTVPAGGAGTYELEFVADTQFSFSTIGTNQVTLQVFKNAAEVNVNVQKRIAITNANADGGSYIIPALVKISNVTLAVGDILDVRSTSTSPATAFLNFGVLTINRLS
jgi:hypothetical protein